MSTTIGVSEAVRGYVQRFGAREGAASITAAAVRSRERGI